MLSTGPCAHCTPLSSQPLRSSLFLHSLSDSVDASVSLSLSLPGYSERPGPLEAGHRKGLILTPVEAKTRRSRSSYAHCAFGNSLLHAL